VFVPHSHRDAVLGRDGRGRRGRHR
jgi:hypothetical protein